jgi:hypothetical protein
MPRGVGERYDFAQVVVVVQKQTVIRELSKFTRFTSAGWWQNTRALDESPVGEYSSGQQRVFTAACAKWPTFRKTTEIARKHMGHREVV